MSRTRKGIVASIVFALVSLQNLGASASTYETETVRMAFHPPVGSEFGVPNAKAKLNCGWHVSCLELTVGFGLDWDDDDESGDAGTCCIDPPGGADARAVRTRFYTYRTLPGADPDDTVDAGHLGYIETDGACEEVSVEICVRPTDENELTQLGGVMYYQHTTSVHRVPYQFTASKNGIYSSALFARMVTADKPGCPWTNVHAHEEHRQQPGDWTTNSSVPNADAERIYDDPSFESAVWSRKLAWARETIVCDLPVCLP